MAGTASARRTTGATLNTARWRRRATPYLFVAPAVLALAFLMVYPIGQLIQFSLFDNLMVKPNASLVGGDNFAFLLGDQIFWLSLTNTVVFTVASVALHLLLGLALALLLNQKLNPPVRSAFRGILILPWMFTAAVVAINWRLILNPLGVLNGLLVIVGLINPVNPINWFGEPELAMPALILVNLWRGYPFIMLMLLAGLQSIPAELYEAGAVDGAGNWSLFRNITLPGIKPVIMSVGLLDAIWNFRLFDLVYLTTGGGPMNQTQVLATYIYRMAFESFEFGKASALAVVVLVVTLVLAAGYLRYQKTS